MARKFTTLHTALAILALFAGAARAAAPESVEQRVCIDGCRDTFLQCMVDGGFDDEAPYQACRAALQACRAECTRLQRPA